jgi:hypothetical protein
MCHGIQDFSANRHNQYGLGRALAHRQYIKSRRSGLSQNFSSELYIFNKRSLIKGVNLLADTAVIFLNEKWNE